METRIPAEVFPPGDFIQEEIDSRGWSAEQLAQKLGLNLSDVNELLSGMLPISTELANELAAAFGTSKELWLNLESIYRSSLTSSQVAPAFSN